MTEPVADHRHVNASRYKTDCGRVTKRMRRHPLGSQGRRLLRCSRHVLLQLEPNTGGAQRFTITVDEYWLVLGSWASFQQGFEEINGFGPKGAGPLFTSLSDESNLSRRFQADRARAKIQCFLNPRAGVVEKGEQGMVALTLNGSKVGLR